MNIKDVEALAELAKIELSEDEKKTILKDMEGILEYVKVIEKVEVGDTKIEDKLYNVWREDQTEMTKFSPEFSHTLITEQFPAAQDGFLKVKKIL